MFDSGALRLVVLGLIAEEPRHGYDIIRGLKGGFRAPTARAPDRSIRSCKCWRRLALLGDAAHAMLPHQGQGANTTIEDAATLAGLIAGDPQNLDAAFDVYDRMRRARTRKIQRASWTGNHALHAPDGPDWERRNERVARFPDLFGWIHEFHACEAVQSWVQARRRDLAEAQAASDRL